jgi:hypothetical protein
MQVREQGLARRNRALLTLAAFVALVIASGFATASADAYEPVGSDFRISNASDIAANRDSLTSAVAYNPTANEYLVVWSGDGLVLTDNELEIFGQRVSADGTAIGADFRISTVGTDGDPDRNGAGPAVAYNASLDEYLVVWQADALATDQQFEIFGQRINADGTEDGTDDFQISDVGSDGDPARNATRPSVACCSAANEYLVVWQDDGAAADNEFEIFGQRVTATGSEEGADFPISNAGDLSGTRVAEHPSVAFNSTDDEFLATWDCDCVAANNDEFEIFGQRVNANGTEDGVDFRISNIGLDDDDLRAAFFSGLNYNPISNEYLVAFQADGLAEDDELEIFGQRVNGDGTEAGTDFRISNVGTDGDGSRTASAADVAYSSVGNEYLVTWVGEGLPTAEEFEIFGQRVTATGAELGTDFRISNVGTDTDADRDALGGALAYGSTPDQYLATWDGDGLAADQVFEIFGRRLAVVPPVTPPPAPTPTTTPPIDPFNLKAAIKKCKKKFPGKAKAKKRKKCIKKAKAKARA